MDIIPLSLHETKNVRVYKSTIEIIKKYNVKYISSVFFSLFLDK
jgi:hypothetical protein